MTSPRDRRALISVVVPAYNESDCVEELGRRLQAVFDSLPAYDFEAVIVENGSADDTYEKLVRLHEHDARFRVVQLARNFGMDGGITAGLVHVSGDAVVIMTADLQDPPELIGPFLEKWEEGFENVYGIVTSRQGTGPMRRFNSQAFYWLLSKLTDDRIPRNASDFRLVDRKVVDTINTMNATDSSVVSSRGSATARSAYLTIVPRVMTVSRRRTPARSSTSPFAGYLHRAIRRCDSSRWLDCRSESSRY